jgi:cyclopropane fatty-acyl-phospholipid synthase-like methyltransferase
MRSPKQRRWETFFDHHADVYMDNVFTKNTAAEIEFLIEELALPKGSAILDVGCGTGRHTVGLAKRGFKMTGLDLSSGMLAKAQEAADKAKVAVELVHGDATRMAFDRRFDAVICLCEGSFGLLGLSDDPLTHDLDILKRIEAALKPGGKLILGALSGTKKIREYSDADVGSGKFDPFTLVDVFVMEYETEGGTETVEVRERGYIASELSLILQLAGLTVKNIWGGTAGNWRRGPLELDEYELMVVAGKDA